MTKQEFFARGNEYFFFDEPEKIAAYCLENWEEDCKHIIRVADEVCDNYYLFDLKWDMERTWEPVIFKDKVDWGYMPGDDPEFIYQFNRHRFFICLGQAYQLTKNEKYAKKFAELLSDWIHTVKHTPETEKTTWRILEAGIRGEFWTKAFRYFKDSPVMTDELVDDFYRCLVEHGEYIIAMHSPYRYMSNWGVMENHGLFEIGVAMPDKEKRERYIKIALEHLEVEARMQIMGDGVQWEQSPMYHNEVFHCFEDVLILAGRNQIPVPESIVEATRRMAYADMTWKKPDHHQIIMGDSDDTDVRDYISVAAYLFKDPVLKFGGFDRLDFESVWDLGMKAALEYEKMEKKEPDFTSRALADSGNYYMRTDWSEEADFLHFHCGTMGAGHGHSDKLHVDLVVKGEDVLMDAGRYNYVAGPNRYEFKNPDSHNTITVDGKYFTVCQDSWMCSKLCQPVKQEMVIKNGYEFVQGGHLGYMDMEKGVYVNRKIIHINPDLYVIADEMYTGDEHSYEQYWHFNNEGTVKLSEASGGDAGKAMEETLNSMGGSGFGYDPCFSDQAEKKEEIAGAAAKHTAVYKGRKAEARFYFTNGFSKAEMLRTRVSRTYNEAKERDSIRVSVNGKGFASFLTVIHTGAAGEMEDLKVEKIPVKSALKGSYYPSRKAEALKITGKEREYVVVICHQEVNSPTDMAEADGCMGYGQVIVFNKKEDELVGTVLCY